MMSESFDANSRFDRFGEDLRLSLDGAHSPATTDEEPTLNINTSSNAMQSNHISPYSNNNANTKTKIGSPNYYADGRRSSADDLAGGGLGGVMCSSSFSQLANAQSKIDSLKTWSVSAYKCTRQAITERLGKGSRTVDSETEQHIAHLREVQRRYEQLLTLARSLASHFNQMKLAQQSIGDYLVDLSHMEPELANEYAANAETYKLVAKNGDALLGALNFFISTVTTLCHKTIEDTMLTVRNFETARLEYDAYRADYEAIQQLPTRGSDHQARVLESEQMCQQHKQRYDQLRDDVQIKMRFLHENKVKVMKKQLLLLHNATAAYFSGNQKSLELSLEQFKVKPAQAQPSTNSASWLES